MEIRKEQMKMISEDYNGAAEEELEPLMEYGDNEEPFTSECDTAEESAAADYFKLDYTLVKPEERVEFLNKLIKENEGSDKLKNNRLKVSYL